MSQGIVQAFRDFGSILQGQLPGSTGTPIPPDASRDAVWKVIDEHLEQVFRDRDKAINFCESLIVAKDDPDDLEEVIVAAAVNMFLQFTLAGIAARLAALAVRNVAREAMRAAFNESIKAGVTTLATGFAQTARQTTADLILAVFEGQRLALSHLWTETKSAFHLRFEATYLSAGTAAAANAYFEELRLFLVQLRAQAYKDQLFASAGGYASALAQQELGLFDPATWDHNQSSIERRGTDIFTKGESWLVDGVETERTGYVRGVVYLETIYGSTGNPRVDLETSGIISDPTTGEPVGVHPDWKVDRIYRGWWGGMPEKLNDVLITRPLAEWPFPRVIVNLFGYTFRINELGEVRVEDGTRRCDAEESRRLYDAIGKPVMMRMPKPVA